MEKQFIIIASEKLMQSIGYIQDEHSYLTRKSRLADCFSALQSADGIDPENLDFLQSSLAGYNRLLDEINQCRIVKGNDDDISLTGKVVKQWIASVGLPSVEKYKKVLKSISEQYTDNGEPIWAEYVDKVTELLGFIIAEASYPVKG